MEIRFVKASFSLPSIQGGTEHIGFTVALNDDETVEEIVNNLRERAIKIVGKKTHALYTEKWELEKSMDALVERLDKIRQEWEATAIFLKAQGLNPEAPAMPQFSKLLNSVKAEAVIVEDDEDESDEYENYDEDDDDNIM
jgi:hypothetical protein